MLRPLILIRISRCLFFETTIRYLGGLLGAYALSGDELFLEKARELGDVLMKAYNTPTGIPYNSINLQTGKGTNPGYTNGGSILSEIGSVQLEFKYLSHLTGDSKYAEAAQKVMDVLEDATEPTPGLYPIYVDPNTGKYVNKKVTFGALADSFYEYLLKQFLQTQKTEPQFEKMYIESIEAMSEKMVGKSGGFTYVGDFDSGSGTVLPIMDHLFCFVPGMLALGSAELEGENREKDLELAKKN
eukprot:Lithocolla_globosa_v1_NODE_5177_length_1288_cov_2.825629.p1 type:complete len:243 gc:universal NODE_5177_length_1288_cov_2.825629:1074-346(-)